MATHRARPVRDGAPAELAIISLVCGVVGLALAFVPGVNWWSGAAAAFGGAVGLVGIWLSRQVLSGVGVVLCGAAIMLTILVMQVHQSEVDREMEQQFHLELPLSAPVAQGVSGGC